MSKRRKVRAFIGSVITVLLRRAATVAGSVQKRRSNRVQRRGFFASLALATLVIYLHFPFHGYEYEHFVVTHYGVKPCPSGRDASGQLSMDRDSLDKWYEDMKRCQDRGEMQTLPFSLWHSEAPIVNWLGYVDHMFAALFLIFLLGGLWLWIFRTHDDG
jgi:hypothetical protein